MFKLIDVVVHILKCVREIFDAVIGSPSKVWLPFFCGASISSILITMSTESIYNIIYYIYSRTFVKFCLFWIAFSRSALTFIAPIDQLIPAKLSSLKCCCSTNWADQLFAKEDGESRVCNLSIRIYPCSRTHWSSTLGKENSFQYFKIR